MNQSTESQPVSQKFPPIVFGTTCLGNLFKAINNETKLEIVKQWFAQTTTPIMIDSAGKYGAGLALESLAQSLAELKISPDDVIISNKLGWRRVPLTTDEPTFEPGAWVDLKYDAVQEISYDGILRCWEEGDELLGDYRTNLVSVHDPDEFLAAAKDETDRSARMNDILQAYQALQTLKQEGKVSGIGIGAKDWRTIQELADHCELDWVMMANSFTIYQHPPELIAFIERLARNGISIINSAVFHAGFLTGGEFFDYRKINPTDTKDQALLTWRKQFNTICEQFQVTPAEACVAFAKSPPGITSIALSSSKPERVADNVALINVELPKDFWNTLRDEQLIDSNYPYLG